MRALIIAIACNLFLGVSVNAQTPPVEVLTLSGKFVMGFMGWYMCPGDGRPNGGWVHWFARDRPDADHAQFDILPDTSELTPSERCLTSLHTSDGRPIHLFSDENPQTVLRQFQWMRQYGIESVALQRFVKGAAPNYPAASRAALDHILDNVRNAAEKTGLAFFIMYDIAGADPSNWATALATDWQRLLDRGLASSPMYQRHRGHPVLEIAGTGSSSRPGEPDETFALLQTLRTESQNFGGVTLIGAVATGWRTRDHDAKRDARWTRVYHSFDVLSPWTGGRYKDAESFNRFLHQWTMPDIAEAKREGIEYMPVVFPGTSAHNITHVRNEERPMNAIPRQCGQFLWMQAAAYVRAGPRMLFGAMFDYVEEGTALFKLVANPANIPAQASFLPLDGVECTVPNDWYLKVSNKIADLVHGKIAPTQQLPLALPLPH
jgi:hypothetical protein